MFITKNCFLKYSLYPYLSYQSLSFLLEFVHLNVKFETKKKVYHVKLAFITTTVQTEKVYKYNYF